MAMIRRGLASLVAKFSRLSAAGVESAAGAAPVPTLVSLRSLALPAAQQCIDSSWAASAAPGSSRQYAAAAAGGSGGTPPRLQAATAAQQAAGDDNEEESLEHIRARIFGNHIGNGLRSGRKVLARALVGARVAAYYPEDPCKADPLMLSIKAETAKLKLDRLRRRGKAPPKKGAGKRAGKKK